MQLGFRGLAHVGELMALAMMEFEQSGKAGIKLARRNEINRLVPLDFGSGYARFPGAWPGGS